MNSREELLCQFLQKNNIDDYKIDKIADDASFRRYFRVVLNDASKDNKKFIIMDAPPKHEDVKPFCNIGTFLLENNFSSPKIFASDTKNGFLLLEDFGDDSYRKTLEKTPALEANLYKLAIDLLLDLHTKTPPINLPTYNTNLLLKEVMLFIDWHLPHVAKIEINKTQILEFKKIWQELFSNLSKPSVLALRDYHADNLMLLQDRHGIQKVGLLDFQDALIGHKSYDLVSLLEDARRNVSLNFRNDMLEYYIENSNCARDQTLLDYKILSLQRNIKIIGIFSRLATRDNKQNYLNFLPRVFHYVNSRLEDPFFTKINQFLSNILIINHEK